MNSREECHIEEYEDTGIPVCSECGAAQPDEYTVYYCWCCGRKMVDGRMPLASRIRLRSVDASNLD